MKYAYLLRYSPLLSLFDFSFFWGGNSQLQRIVRASYHRPSLSVRNHDGRRGDAQSSSASEADEGFAKTDPGVKTWMIVQLDSFILRTGRFGDVGELWRRAGWRWPVHDSVQENHRYPCLGAAVEK